MTHDAVMERAEEIKAWGEAAERVARDEVNQPRINDWLEAMDFPSASRARFQGGEAPPSMAQVWTMYGLGGRPADDDPLHAMMGFLTSVGYTAVLGTNCEQDYIRYLRVGERVRVTTALVDVVGPKTTGMGEGYFVTSRNTWWVDAPEGSSEKVATMLFRVLKFRPAR
ncbi:FAS1-like dehydratase domain-containing protein [Nocardioides sp. Kera G14]|uniref:FAS1-like dehydratase domain-containing protein n=1 Tax=Nocardioides sp. Kera G14 TaxID=2884264 RepID=UPI001D12BE78|nr:MaoC family dehydratase N-terminal domain-containing protein [Nocardioides sp. Kera G14]UDY22290.1 MaoC family dehydratase N-terminal domain-containing protein [Nocardioides sp. Kera G14]